MDWCKCESPLRRSSFNRECVTCGGTIRLNDDEYTPVDARLRVRTFNFQLEHKTLDFGKLMSQCQTDTPYPINTSYHGMLPPNRVDWDKFGKRRDAVIAKVLNGFRSLGGYVVLDSPNYHDEAYAVWVVEWDGNYYIFSAHEFPNSLSLIVNVLNVDRLGGKFEMLVNMVFEDYKFFGKAESLWTTPLTVTDVMEIGSHYAEEEYKKQYGV